MSVKELRSTNCQLQNSHGDEEYSIGNIVKSIITTMYSAREVVDLSEGSHHELYKCLTTKLYT